MVFSNPETLKPALVRADPVERFFAPQAMPRLAERTRAAIFFAGLLVCHIVLLSAVLFYGFKDPPPVEQEISVEVVPPPEQEPPAQPPPRLPQPRLNQSRSRKKRRRSRHRPTST